MDGAGTASAATHRFPSDRGARGAAPPGRGLLRAGVIGLGVGAQHARAYANDRRCQLSVLCDTSRAVSREVGEQFRGVELRDNWHDVIDDPAIDVVSICTYDDGHAEQVIAAIEAGKHVFVEKPLCLTIEEARVICAALAAHPEVVLSSNLPLRGSPRFQRVKQMIESGDFGEVYHLEADYLYGRLHKLTDGWRGRIPNYSVTLGGAVHMVDLLLWMTGGTVEEVTAYGNDIATRGIGLAINDHVVALLRFADGMTAKVSANFGCVRPHEHGLSVYGTKATFVNGLEHGLVYLSRDPSAKPQAADDPHPGVGKGDQISSFVSASLGEGPAIVPVGEVFRTMSVCLAIDRSAREGQPARVEYV